ncbi:hypothetical protein [Spirosoma flavum]|uniref:Outer membrane protein beta-barrel domain-containing protein n=1 Tax=Spirosoma flavum TaxID=2048557 RepID=A0ABW6AK25_9BACT
MRIFFWFLVGTAILALVNQAGAQDSLNYSTNSLTLTQSTTIDTSPGKWRLSGFVGYHQQYQKGYLNENLYLTNGLTAGLATDYFVGPNWGIGIMIGYQNLAVSDLYRQDPSIPKYPFPRILPLTSLHSFMLTIGPAFSFPLARRLSLDINLRGGLFYNDAPILGAYLLNSTQDNLLTGTLLGTTVIPSSQRVRLGFNGSVGVKYQFTQQLSLGLAANDSYSSVGYTQVNVNNNFFQKRVDLKMYGVQAEISYRFSPSSQRTKTAPPVPPTPVCYPPLLDTAQPNLYEVGTAELPVFKWRSSAPVYTEGERYTFRLYTLPGNKVVYEKVVQEPQLVWPAQVPLPDTASYYFYTVHTSRSDEFEQSCRSEPVVGTLGFLKNRPVAQSQVVTPREPVNLFRLRLYVLDSVVVTQVKRQPIEVAKRSKTRTRRPDTSQTQPTSETSAPADSLQSVTKIMPRLIYEGPMQQPNFVWPNAITLPARPAVYQYVINRISNREMLQSYYLMVEPDGCSIIINEATKNKYLQNNMVPTEPPKPDSSPTNKGQP